MLIFVFYLTDQSKFSSHSTSHELGPREVSSVSVCCIYGFWFAFVDAKSRQTWLLVLPYYFHLVLFSVADFGSIKVTKDNDKCLDYKSLCSKENNILIKMSIHLPIHLCSANKKQLKEKNNRKSLKYKYKKEHSMWVMLRIII